MSLIRKPPRPRGVPHLEKILLAIIVMVLSVLPWFLNQPEPDTLTIWMLDIGQGDATFIQAPTGEQLLIDAGPSTQVLTELGQIMPPWDRHIDAIALTHPDSDHLNGFMPLLDVYQVDAIYETGARAHTANDQDFVKATQGTSQLLSAGDTLTLGEVELQVLWPKESLDGTYPDERNNASLIILISYHGTEFLLMGDAEKDVEQTLAQTLPNIDILKTGHHGSATSTSWDLLEATQPEVALISSGYENRYGHPHAIVLDRLTQEGIEVFRTDLDGTVKITIDEHGYTVEPELLPF